MNRYVGVKHYGLEWFERFEGDYLRDADALISHAVDFVIVQNLLAPVPTTAAAIDIQQAGTAGGLPRDGYDDTRLREALRARDIEYYEVLPMFFDPARTRTMPGSRPVANTGTRMRQHGWYVGLCPTDPVYLDDRATMAEEIVASLRPKGLYLDWIRFPGFWEMWLPDTKRSDLLNYCFCVRCVESFQVFSGEALPDSPTVDAASLILNELAPQWIDWKCWVITDAIGTIKKRAQRQAPDIEVMTSNVAFGRDDYENAIEEVLGQRVESMAQHADVFTFMFYHQIVRRDPAPWIAQVAIEMERRTSRPFLGTVQVKAAYLERPYAVGRRNAVISTAELVSALRSIAASPADGVVLYHWSDYLEHDDRSDRSLRDAMWSFREEVASDASPGLYADRQPRVSVP